MGTVPKCPCLKLHCSQMTIVNRGNCKTPLPHHSRAKPHVLKKPAETPLHDREAQHINYAKILLWAQGENEVFHLWGGVIAFLFILYLILSNYMPCYWHETNDRRAFRKPLARKSWFCTGCAVVIHVSAPCRPFFVLQAHFASVPRSQNRTSTKFCNYLFRNSKQRRQ